MHVTDVSDFVELMNSDLSHELMHLQAYLYYGTCIEGIHRHEIGEFLLEESKNELKHCEEFIRVILGLGGVPTSKILPFPYLNWPKSILIQVLQMEETVVQNYAHRMSQAETVLDPNGSFLHVFYENQILDSRRTVDHVRLMLKGL